MPRLLPPLVLLVLTLFASAADARQGPMLTPEQVARDVALAQEAYDRIHPGYTRYADAATLDA
ncbi:MAG: hypothetical protein AAF350_05085, partial [Pseudomonadota bacterium]